MGSPYGDVSGRSFSCCFVLQFEVGEDRGVVVRGRCQLQIGPRGASPQQREREHDAHADRGGSDEERDVVAADQGTGDAVVGGEQPLGVVGRNRAQDGESERAR